MSVSLKRKRSDAAQGSRPAPGPGSVEDRPEPRKVVAACTACRRQKIKCDMPSEEPPCARCKRKGLSCVLHTSASRNTHLDHKQVGLLSKDMSNVFFTLQLLCGQLGVEPPKPLLSVEAGPSNGPTGPSAEGNDDTGEYEPGVYELSPPASPSTVQAPIDPYLSSGPPDQDGHPVVAGSVSPEEGRRRAGERPDLITKGIISLARAESLVQRYLTHLDRFLYGIASQYRDAHEVRKASPTLLAAMCTVSAFQNVESKELFDVCYKEFRHLVSISLFEKRDLEYIRALCIGSFWLLDSSRILLSDAIRRAADSRLHRHFHRLNDQPPKTATPSTSPMFSSNRRNEDLTGKPKDDARDKLRLWYLLLVSDRHLSILHNRDALIRQEKDAIEYRDRFLNNDQIGPAPNSDIRLISQVSLHVIMGQIRDVLGCETARPLPKTSVVQFSHFNHELDQWFEKYSPFFEPDPHIGTFPLAGLTMHAHYARLYLSHYVFQGLGDNPIPLHFLPVAMASREAAHNIFSLLLENVTFRDNIVGMPHYFHIMLSFAGHFLLELAMKYRDQLAVDAQEDIGRVAAMVALYARTTVMPQHPIARVPVGMTRKLKECATSLGMESMLTGSPFQNIDYTNLMPDFGNLGDGGSNGAGTMFASVDMQTVNGLPDDFLWGDFTDLHLPIPEP